MKKFAIFCLAFALLTPTIVIDNTIYAEKPSSAAVKLPVSELQEKGILLKGNTLLPAAALLKEMGIQLEFNTKSGSIGYSYGQTKVSAQLNSKYVWINGVKQLYTLTPQLINGQLMLPLQMIKDSLKVKASEGHGASMKTGQTPINSVTLTSSTKQILIRINNAYEAYQTYLGKTAWIHTDFRMVWVVSLLDGTLTHAVTNLDQVKITKIESNLLISDWIDVYFTYQNKSYKMKNLDSDKFKAAFLFTNPFTTYKFPQQYWQIIEKNQITADMTGQMVELSLGKPDRVLNAGKNSSTWVYDIAPPELSLYLKFEKGLLKSYSDKK